MTGLDSRLIVYLIIASKADKIESNVQERKVIPVCDERDFLESTQIPKYKDLFHKDNFNGVLCQKSNILLLAIKNKERTMIKGETFVHSKPKNGHFNIVLRLKYRSMLKVW
jgi:hypothetical protein